MSTHKHVKKQHKPPPQATPEAVMRRTLREHMDLLQNVEFVIVKTYREDPELDDAAVVRALRALIKMEEPEDDRAAALAADILDLDELRPEISDRLWSDVYRVVLESVHTHSTLQPGNRGYLDFVAEYIR